jgi:hypothetical protein
MFRVFLFRGLCTNVSIVLPHIVTLLSSKVRIRYFNRSSYLCPNSFITPQPTTNCKMTLWMLSPLVRVIVGPEDAPTEMFIHKDKITSRSQFFKSALNGEWQNAQTNTLTLSDINPTIFAAYLQLVYTSALEPKAKRAVNELISHYWFDEFYYYAELYVLAERMIDPTSKNILIQGMIDLRHDSYPPATIYPNVIPIQVIWEGTASANNPARRLFLAMYAGGGDEEWLLSEDFDDCPADFVRQLSAILLGQKRVGGRQPQEVLGAEGFLEEVDEEDEDGDGNGVMNEGANGDDNEDPNGDAVMSGTEDEGEDSDDDDDGDGISFGDSDGGSEEEEEEEEDDDDDDDEEDADDDE